MEISNPASGNLRHAQPLAVGYTCIMEAWRKRLAERIADLGLTPRVVTKRAGVNATMVHDILNRNSTPSVENLHRIAKVVGLTLSELYEGTERVHLTLRLDGLTMGADVWSEVPPRHARVVPLEILSEDTVSIEITDDALAPRYDRGDVLSGPKFWAPHFDNLVGTDCMVQLEDGTRRVGILLRGGGSNTYSIRSLNPRSGDIRDARLAWAAPVRMILRAPSKS